MSKRIPVDNAGARAHPHPSPLPRSPGQAREERGISFSRTRRFAEKGRRVISREARRECARLGIFAIHHNRGAIPSPAALSGARERSTGYGPIGAMPGVLHDRRLRTWGHLPRLATLRGGAPCQNGGGWQSLALELANGGGSMPWRRFGAPIAVIVLLFALGRISSIVVDWAWFSSIGYVGVFWTVFATKAALFVVVFAVSTLLLWANASLAYRFASRPRLRLPAVFDPGVATFRASPGWAGSYALQPSPLVWRLIILIVAVVLGLLIAMGESGRWDLVLRFLYQTPYGHSDPQFEKDIGFYSSRSRLRRCKNGAMVARAGRLHGGATYFVHGAVVLDPPHWSARPRRSPTAPRSSAFSSLVKACPMDSTAISCSTTTTAYSSARARPTSIPSCRRCGCSSSAAVAAH